MTLGADRSVSRPHIELPHFRSVPFVLQEILPTPALTRRTGSTTIRMIRGTGLRIGSRAAPSIGITPSDKMAGPFNLEFALSLLVIRGDDVMIIGTEPIGRRRFLGAGIGLVAGTAGLDLFRPPAGSSGPSSSPGARGACHGSIPAPA
jgi:hypothetical protein